MHNLQFFCTALKRGREGERGVGEVVILTYVLEMYEYTYLSSCHYLQREITCDFLFD